MSANKTYTLGRQERLKSRKKIELLFRDGKVMNLYPFRVSYLLTEEKNLQIGVGAGKRYFKKAVHRNKIKRLLREAWRLQKNELLEITNEQQKGLDVFIVYVGKELPSFSEISTQVKQVIDRLISFINKEGNNSSTRKSE
ncbi:MAG: ribonuclease P protein component [Bacteroidota bacterium]|jgi:ribonuclease P protein component